MIQFLSFAEAEKITFKFKPDFEAHCFGKELNAETFADIADRFHRVRKKHFITAPIGLKYMAKHRQAAEEFARVYQAKYSDSPEIALIEKEPAELRHNRQIAEAQKAYDRMTPQQRARRDQALRSMGNVAE